VFPTSDCWITLVVMRNTEFVPFCEAITRPDLADDPRFATAVSRHEHADVLTSAINAAMSGQSAAYWSARLTEAGIVHEILNNYAEFLEHPQAKADNAVNWLDQPGLSTPAPIPSLAGVKPPKNGSPRGTAPQLGQHSSEILQCLGYDDGTIDALAKDGVIGGPNLPTIIA
jgi:crotonobetainyl-CoA:carnitine CoA-transferase CaiB-like acyl-CoA transferase